VPAGHALLVPAERPSEATALSLTQAVFTTVPQGRTSYYHVRRGDTLSSIARRHHVTTAELRAWNGMTQSAIRAGQQLRINSESAPGASVQHRARVRGTAKAKAPVKKASASAKRRAPSSGHAAKSSTRTKEAASTHGKAIPTAARSKAPAQATASNGNGGG
jgi:LysM repeat protein